MFYDQDDRENRSEENAERYTSASAFDHLHLNSKDLRKTEVCVSISQKRIIRDGPSEKIYYYVDEYKDHGIRSEET